LPDVHAGPDYWPVNKREWLTLSRERDLWMKRVLEAEKRGFDRGVNLGREQGFALADAELERSWRTLAAGIMNAPSFADLEFLRWGPGGREKFGQPRPGDYKGGPVAWK
jgi:hypothetical protein